MSGLSTFQRGPKGSDIVNQDVFYHLGPFWARVDLFGPFQTKNDFLLESTSANPTLSFKQIAAVEMILGDLVVKVTTCIQIAT